MEHTKIEDILSYYMGKNTPERQVFIIENLKVELDEINEENAGDEEAFDLAADADSVVA